ncbi:glycosyltransferase family 4 protein [Mameliella alba]|uniref:Glycosyl transferase n=1 Tax=Mameliella alba TaxID=561184 RepID=A0A0B3SHW2_9RHOB|nr:glycosyltransferase family 4 protein [Mameliella alba]KHQ50164.1 Glycosyl transferase [Mameliella alba]
MKIAIASLGRFHVLDLARELDALGEEIRFHSYVPRRRAERFGLPARCHRGFFPAVAPLLAWQHKASKVWHAGQERAMAHALDAAVTARLEPCDVFICMSGMYLNAARHAKRKYGARVYLERGSQHILAQRRILESLGAARKPTDFIVAREQAGYELADRIAVPSTPVVDSFLEEAPHLKPKLFVNPYGVDLELFPQRSGQRADGPLRVLFVGGWSLRKGTDILERAIRSLPGVHLTHVGGLVDRPFPKEDAQFTHVGQVPQWQLKEHYARADVMVLASREEGLALVQPQALASGLPLVCTTRTGGADLRLTPELSERITVVPPDDAEALAQALSAALEQGRERVPLPEADRAQLSWAAYGARYQQELHGGGFAPHPCNLQ